MWCFYDILTLFLHKYLRNSEGEIMTFIEFITDVGVPIGGAVVMGFFIFMVLKQIFDGIIDEIKTLTGFCKMLEDRARVGCNELVKIDMLVSSALDLSPPIDRVARAENIRTDEKCNPQNVKLDVRRD